ncbi:hypothetical protein V501_00274, partial [Pseudogymnoascus sp. VKM F-4519 (FW-2642)]
QTVSLHYEQHFTVSSNTYNHVEYEESMARVVWAANILYYLVGERNQSQLFPELDEDDDAKTENEVVLTGSGDLVRSKFLDCVAVLASPSKGWDYVVATGLKESVDSIEIGIARNDGFHIAGGLQSTTSHAKKAKKLNTQYLDHLQKYIASASEESICGQSLTWFDCLAIEYNRERIDYWTASARQCIASLPPFQEDHAEDYSSTFQQAAKMWADLTKLLSYKETGETLPREQIVHSAYQCIASIKVGELLHTIFKSQIGSKLWRILGFIARPVSNCRLLIRIASRLPHFRKVKIIPLLPGPKLKLNPKYLIDITDAWCRLDPDAQPGCELKTLSSFKATFKEDCSRKLSSHAEVQLFSYYVASQLPSIDYFGCSKKSCLLCEGFLQALSRPISTRGRHGICYPAWIVPFTKSEDIILALQQLEQSLVRQINHASRDNLRVDINGFLARDEWTSNSRSARRLGHSGKQTVLVVVRDDLETQEISELAVDEVVLIAQSCFLRTLKVASERSATLVRNSYVFTSAPRTALAGYMTAVEAHQGD